MRETIASATARSRAGSCRLGALCVLLVLLFPAAPARSAEPAVEFMKQVSRDLIAAAKTGSQQAFADAIQKYGHVPAIGHYALGNYGRQLRPNDRQSYYAGMVRFLARYAASVSPNHPVSHAEILSPAVREDNVVYVDSRVHFESGSTYEVRWMLVPQGRSFRVRDAQVFGFWMSPFLKRMFEDYIGQNGGNLRALLTALRR
jgi:phospholipid transport system substrate-binding protein